MDSQPSPDHAPVMAFLFEMEGYAAASASEGSDTNPYPGDYEQSQLWAAGWARGIRDRANLRTAG